MSPANLRKDLMLLALPRPGMFPRLSLLPACLQRGRQSGHCRDQGRKQMPGTLEQHAFELYGSSCTPAHKCKHGLFKSPLPGSLGPWHGHTRGISAASRALIQNLHVNLTLQTSISFYRSISVECTHKHSLKDLEIHFFTILFVFPLDLHHLGYILKKSEHQHLKRHGIYDLKEI